MNDDSLALRSMDELERDFGVVLPESLGRWGLIRVGIGGACGSFLRPLKAFSDSRLEISCDYRFVCM